MAVNGTNTFHLPPHQIFFCTFQIGAILLLPSLTTGKLTGFTTAGLILPGPSLSLAAPRLAGARLAGETSLLPPVPKPLWNLAPPLGPLTFTLRNWLWLTVRDERN